MTHVPPDSAPGGSPPSRRRVRNPQGTRDRLVRAALDLFTTQGYEASTTLMIAQRAGVAEGTIYRHFQNKAHLLNEIYRAGVRLLLRPVREMPGAGPCRERLDQIVQAWRDLAERDPSLVRLVFVERWGERLDPKSLDLGHQLRDELGRVIAAGKSAGEVRPGSVDVLTDVWLALVVLMLEKVATREWTATHGGPAQVLQAAWAAIRETRFASGP